MVNLPEGKMKSREGTVVDADDLLDELERLAAEEIRTKEREEDVGDLGSTARDVALGALHYWLLQVTAGKDMTFDPKESISFNGNTGPYLQYTGARISSMLRKFEERKESFRAGTFSAEAFPAGGMGDCQVAGALSRKSSAAANELNPSVLAAADATGQDLVVVSSTIASGDVNTKFTEVAVPVVTWESNIYGSLKLTGPTGAVDFGTVANLQQVQSPRHRTRLRRASPAP